MSNTIDLEALAGVTGGASTAVTAVKNAVMSEKGGAGLLDFGKLTQAPHGLATEVCGSFKVHADPKQGRFKFCGTYDPTLGAPSPDINVRDLTFPR